MTRRISHARLERLEAVCADATPDVDDAAVAEGERALAAPVELVKEHGIVDKRWPSGHGYDFCQSRSARAFIRSLPFDVIDALFDGEDISATYPLHARAWGDPDSLSVLEWIDLNAARSVW